MPIHSTLPEDLRQVDVIIVGGGTAGCIVASRLADQDQDISILVIESGSNNLDVPVITHPALYRANFAPEHGNTVTYTSKNEPQLLHRDVDVTVGGCLGGGSSVNAMIYARPQAVDFDSWGFKGWTSRELMPFLQKLETFHSPNSGQAHGSEGPIQVSANSFPGDSVKRDFIDTMTQLGYPEVNDLQDLHNANGVAQAFRYVSPEHGKRQDSAHRYLHPRIQQEEFPNLHVLVESQVTRLLVGGNKNVGGVEYRSNPRVSKETPSELLQIVKARKLVIVSAGAFGTPLLLERSGIGDKRVLWKAGVRASHHLPGVGCDFQDHQCIPFAYKSGYPPGSTFESIYNGTRSIPDLLANDDPILGWNGVDASAKIRPTESEVKSMSPAFASAWEKDYKNVASKPLASMIFINGILGDPTPFPKGEYFTIVAYTTYPYSRGHVHITGPQIDQPPDFKTGYLSDDDDLDLEIQLWAYKKQREIASRMASLASEISDQQPSFPQDSKASLNSRIKDSPAGETTFEYSREDDEAIKHFIRGKVGTTWHPLGTCKMAALEQMGVVDERLNVHGMVGLKIVDLSIVPKNVSGNTMNAALLVGERAADIIIEDLGLDGRSV